jgi:hypothetical protein
MKVSYIAAAIISAAVLSCATPTENALPAVELLTDRTTYVMGDWGVLTLTNAGGHSIAGDLRYDLVVQRMVGTSWESVDTGPGWRIMEDVRTLAPGASDQQRFQVVSPTFPSAGEYRAQVSVWDPKSQQSFMISSDPFTVRRW